MKVIDLDELKQLQCEVLEALHNYSKENGLKYSLACGTLIGAIRHNGYIPWDDDIDVYMQREDYDKLIKNFPDVYEDHFQLISFERNKHWCRPYANLYDNRTLFKELKSSNEEQIGVKIDIFPVDSVPDDDAEWLRFNKIRRMLIYLHSAKFVTFRKNNQSLTTKISLALLKMLLLPFSSYRIVKLVDTYIRKFNGTGSKRLFETSCGMDQNKPFNSRDFEEVELHKFEDYEFYVMKGYHNCLTNGFGDYMILPPVEKRVSHHYYEAYWKDL